MCPWVIRSLGYWKTSWGTLLNSFTFLVSLVYLVSLVDLACNVWVVRKVKGVVKHKPKNLQADLINLIVASNIDQ